MPLTQDLRFRVQGDGSTVTEDHCVAWNRQITQAGARTSLADDVILDLGLPHHVVSPDHQGPCGCRGGHCRGVSVIQALESGPSTG